MGLERMYIVNKEVDEKLIKLGFDEVNLVGIYGKQKEENLKENVPSLKLSYTNDKTGIKQTIWISSKQLYVERMHVVTGYDSHELVDINEEITPAELDLILDGVVK